MLTALSPEVRIATQLADLRLSAKIFCAVANFSPSKLSAAITGTKPLGGDESTKLLNLLTQIQAIVSAARPLPIALTNAADITNLLRAMEFDHIEPADIRSALNQVFKNQE
jgi:hypothetical protein